MGPSRASWNTASRKHEAQGALNHDNDALAASPIAMITMVVMPVMIVPTIAARVDRGGLATLLGGNGEGLKRGWRWRPRPSRGMKAAFGLRAAPKFGP